METVLPEILNIEEKEMTKYSKYVLFSFTK